MLLLWRCVVARRHNLALSNLAFERSKRYINTIPLLLYLKESVCQNKFCNVWMVVVTTVNSCLFCLSKIERYGYIDTMSYGGLQEATAFDKGQVLKKHLRSATRSKRFALVEVKISLCEVDK